MKVSGLCQDLTPSIRCFIFSSNSYGISSVPIRMRSFASPWQSVPPVTNKLYSFAISFR